MKTHRCFETLFSLILDIHSDASHLRDHWFQRGYTSPLDRRKKTLYYNDVFLYYNDIFLGVDGPFLSAKVFLVAKDNADDLTRKQACVR